MKHGCSSGSCGCGSSVPVGTFTKVVGGALVFVALAAVAADAAGAAKPFAFVALSELSPDMGRDANEVLPVA